MGLYHSDRLRKAPPPTRVRGGWEAGSFTVSAEMEEPVNLP